MPTKTKPATADSVSAVEPDPLDEAMAALDADRKALAAVESELAGIPSRERERQQAMKAAYATANNGQVEALTAERRAIVEHNNWLVDERDRLRDAINAGIARVRAARAGTPLSLDAAAAALAEAEATADRLETEAVGIHHTIDAAVRSADVARIRQSRARAAELPDEQLAAKVAVLRAEAAHAEAEALALPAERDAAYEDMQRAKAALDEAKAAYDAAAGNWRSKRGRESELRRFAAERRLAADQLLRSESERQRAPVVRSLRHAGSVR